MATFTNLAGLAGIYYGGCELYGACASVSLRGRLCIITGAGSGIGRLAALALAAEGVSLALWDIDENAVQGVGKEARALAWEQECVRTYSCDISDRAAVREAGARTLSDFDVAGVGKELLLFNNAGIVSGKSLLDENFDEARAAKTMEVNGTSLIWVTRAFLPAMVAHGQGHVVTLASSAGLAGVAGLVDYCASKHAAVGFNESLRMELGAQGHKRIFTTVVCPSFIATGMFKGAGMPPWMRTVAPVLRPEYVVQRIVEAIKRRNPVLIMPRLGYLSPVLRATLPTVLYDWVCATTGISSSMDNFVQTRSQQGARSKL